MNFDAEVIDLSLEAPVVVDFWAPWCGPCQVIGPILEALASDQSQWKLIKINVDDHPQISQQLGIRGIPDVRLYWRGKEVNRFTGALPKHEIEKWLANNIPDERLAVLDELASAAHDDEGLDKLRAFVSAQEDFKPGFVALAKMILWDNPSESVSLVAPIKLSDKEYTTAKAILDMAELLQIEANGETAIEAALREAKGGFVAGDKTQGIERLIEAVMIDKRFQNELPRRAAIAFFHLVGTEHELTRQFRRKFDMALY
ncbi:MAG: tetratricopeptide repeat protein [Bacteroidota bacterium]